MCEKCKVNGNFCPLARNLTWSPVTFFSLSTALSERRRLLSLGLAELTWQRESLDTEVSLRNSMPDTLSILCWSW